MLEQADRARKMAEQELSDTNETLADLTVQNQSLTSAKRKLDQDLADLRQEADEAHSEVKNDTYRTRSIINRGYYFFSLFCGVGFSLMFGGIPLK